RRHRPRGAPRNRSGGGQARAHDERALHHQRAGLSEPSESLTVLTGVSTTRVGDTIQKIPEDLVDAEKLNRVLIEQPVHGLAKNLGLNWLRDARMRAQPACRRRSRAEEP